LLIALYLVCLTLYSSLLENLVQPLVHDITPHGILHTSDYIVARMPQISMLEDEDAACLGKDIILAHQVVGMEGRRASTELVIFR
jgi:hypothetical protein